MRSGASVLKKDRREKGDPCCVSVATANQESLAAPESAISLLHHTLPSDDN